MRKLLISTFVFAANKVQSLFFRNLKFQAPNRLKWFYVCTAQFVSDLHRTPKDRFFHDTAHYTGLSTQIWVGIFFPRPGLLSDQGISWPDMGRITLKSNALN